MKFKRFFFLLLSAATLAAFPGSAAGALTAADRTIVAFGDSITAAGSWFARAESTFGVQVINQGVGGRNSSEGRQAFSAALALKPDIVLISFGMNDSARDMAKYVPLETYRENLRYMIEQAQKIGARVILVIENPIGEEQYYTRHDRAVFEPYGGINAFNLSYVEAMRGLAEEFGLVTADLYRVFSEQEEYCEFLADGVHPNDKGYALYAEELCSALLRLDLGDVDGNGEVDAKDYMMVKRQVLGTFEIGERQPYADTDLDGDVTAKDYMQIKRQVLGTYEIKRNPE